MENTFVQKIEGLKMPKHEPWKEGVKKEAEHVKVELAVLKMPQDVDYRKKFSHINRNKLA